MIDIHNHLLVGRDDGPATEQESLSLLIQAEENGVTEIVVTPHHKRGDFINPKDIILDEMKILNRLINDNDINIIVYPGQEIRIYGELIEHLDTDVNIGLNFSNYVLVEFSFTEIPSYTEQLFFNLQMKGYIPIIAHPERCKPLRDNPKRLIEFIEKGALTQVTASSLVGQLGENLKKVSLEMLKSNLVHIIGSDAHHSTNRPFMLKQAYAVIEEELGISYVEYLQSNASSIIHNKEVSVKPPIRVSNEIKKNKKRKRFLGFF